MIKERDVKLQQGPENTKPEYDQTQWEILSISYHLLPLLYSFSPQHSLNEKKQLEGGEERIKMTLNPPPPT